MNQSRARTVRLGCALLAAGCANCASQPPVAGHDLPSEVVGTSAHFTHLAWSTNLGDNCPQAVDLWEEYLAALTPVLPSDLPKVDVQYYQFEHLDQLLDNSNCPEGARACHYLGQVFTTLPFDQHELVHAILDPIGETSRVLEEGIANSLSCDGAIVHDNNFQDRATYNDLVSWTGDDANLAASSAVLVAHLVKTRGAEKFWQLYRQVRSADPAALESVLLEVYGRTGGELYDEAWSGEDLGCIRVWECSAPSILVGQKELAARNDCGLPTVHTVLVDTASVLAVAALTLGSCEDEGVFVETPVADSSTPILATLEPGRYFISTASAIGAVVNISSTLLDESFRSSDSCDETWEVGDLESALGVVDQARFALDSRHFEGGSRVLILEEIPAFYPPQELSAECPEGTTLLLCDGCPEEGNCADICAEAAPLPAQPILEVDAPMGTPRFVLDLNGID